MLRSFIVPALLAAALCLPQAAMAKDYVVILSPYLTPEQAKLQAKQLMVSTLDILQPSEKAIFLDGARCKTIATFSLPNNLSSTNIRVKVGLFDDATEAVVLERLNDVVLDDGGNELAVYDLASGISAKIDLPGDAAQLVVLKGDDPLDVVRRVGAEPGFRHNAIQPVIVELPATAVSVP